MSLPSTLSCRMLAIALLLIAGCSTSQAPKVTSPPTPQAKAATPIANPVKKTVQPAKSQAIELNNRAAEKLQKQDYKSALQDFNQVIRANPKFVEAYVGRGIAHSLLGKHREAVNDFSQAIRQKPNFAEAYLNRADDHYQLGNQKQAVADLQKAAALFTKQGDRTSAQMAKTRMEDYKIAGQPSAISVSTATAATASPSNSTAAAPLAPPPPTSDMPPEMLLALHLKRVGAKMYGTYWCGACNWQRKQFGEAAFAQVEYVECDPRGPGARPDLCDRANIRAFPTWELNGRLYPSGAFGLGTMADLTGYKGSRDFGG